MNAAANSMRWVIALLILISAWMAFILYIILSSPALGTRFLGASLLVIGLLNVIFGRRTASKFFARTQTSPSLVAKFWASSGEKGIELLFLGIGIILAVAGCVLLILGTTKS